MKTTLVYGLFVFFIVAIPIVVYAGFTFSLGVAGQFVLGLTYLIILAGLFYYTSSSSVYNRHWLLLTASLVLLMVLAVIPTLF
ncbi:MAG: hypothetical protein OH338_00845 [Candidatus Parvarchaeota archaeon]|nr:hypothetical protein [Candidatus Parvarchaeum tengchongense]MCW1295496.1 hypothetical protein [Candidatus Parvarchaeum tengchongense]MCW1299084.1 hypothetical protein [Candidatus Parvarchaeum tengchongense]MCW1311962.1 hypothetical protein [Candidatus Parvarchaeum tengchongense]